MLKKTIVTLFVVIPFCCAFPTQRKKHITYNDKQNVAGALEIHMGLVSQHATRIKYKQNGKKVAIIELTEPIIVAQAEEEKKWGFFQFPQICKIDSGTLMVSWQLNEDAYTAYGKGVSDRRISRNNGNSWELPDRSYFRKDRYGVEYEKGKMLQVITPSTKDIKSYTSFPSPVNRYPLKGYNFYYESELPRELRGVCLLDADLKNNKSTIIHGNIHDNGLLRYTIDGNMPILWWGNIKQLHNGNLIAGVYPCYYMNAKNLVLKSAISFYKSSDYGHNWELLDRIYYNIGKNDDSCLFDGKEGFSEPAFEILSDSSLFCVIRTNSVSPMFKTHSYDGGKNWTTPRPFTPNGVMPNLLLLENNVLVLTSGRPGVQVRFCFDGKGEKWSEPIEMIKAYDKDGNADIFGATCGYSSIVNAGNNSFYIVYSDFKSKNQNGEYRKAIMFRKIEVSRVDDK